MKAGQNFLGSMFIGRGILFIFSAVLILAASVYAHNLDQIDTSINFDDDFIRLMEQRGEAEEVLIQDGDEFWMVFRSTPGPGTQTGAGGYLTFYIPTNYVEVLDVSYLTPSPGTPGNVEAPTNFTRVPLKGASIIAVGNGTIAPATTTNLIGLTLTNEFGQAENPVTGTGLHRGTIAGVYADTGIFFSQDPRTLYHSWAFAPATGPLSRRGYPVTMVNNRGESITPVTRYDAEQLIAYGRADVAPIVDPNGRGNAPWGLANVVAGPECGYAWQFDLNTWLDTSNMQAAVSSVGPWQRIKYSGSQYASDQAGLISSTLGYAGVDASSLGFALGVDPGEAELPGNANAIRVSYGMLELGRPEYAAVRIRVKNPPAAECFTITTDAFGGDAGGLDGGKDHEWRYYDPTLVTLNPCTYLAKTPSDPVVRPGDSLYFDITFINNGMAAYTNVVLTDTMPAGLTFLSADPPQTGGPNPLVWNLGPVGINEMRQFRIYVRASSVGTFFNRVVATSGTNVLAEAMGVVEVSYRSLLRGDKTVTPDSVVPGGTVTYTLTVYNDGAGPNGMPLVVNELLPQGFTYVGMVDQQINGHFLPAPFLTVNNANPNRPTFSVRDGILPGQTLVLTFLAGVDAAQPAGTYCNSYYLSLEGKIISVPPQACVTVGGGQIGDTVFRDWDGNGTQDAGDEGLANVTLNLYTGACPAVGAPFRTTNSSSSGAYMFTGLDAGSYCVAVATSTAPAGYVLTTANPIGVSLAENEIDLDVDFGFRPGGTGLIGDKVFNDKNGDGLFNGTDVGISNVIVRLRDAEGNLITLATTDANGNYQFTNLATGLTYQVTVNPTTSPGVINYFSPNSFLITTPSAIMIANLAGTDLTADFGFLANLPGSIGDMVFIDQNANGTYDTNDVPLPDVSVLLYRSGSGGEAIATNVSSLTGSYLFTDLAPATYLVVVDTSDPDLPGGLGAAIDRYLVALGASSNYLAADFAFQRYIHKEVDKAYATTNEVLTYTLNASFPGSVPLEDARIIDPFPVGVTFSNATAGGVYGPYAASPAVSGVEQADIVQLVVSNPVADTFVRQDQATVNYGTSNRINLKFSAGANQIGLMRFDLDAIPQGSGIAEAFFSYNVQASTKGGINMHAYRMKTDWTETGATWNTNSAAGSDWTSAGGSFGTNDYAPTAYGPMAVGSTGWKTNDVTALLKEWIEAGVTNRGLALISDKSATATFSSRENAGNEPRLAITYQAGANTTNALAVSSTVVATGQPVTVTMTLWSSVTMSNVTPRLAVNVGSAVLAGPAEAVPATVVRNTPKTFTFTCTPAAMGELVFRGTAEAEEGNDFMESRSASVLVSANGSSNVVTWALGTNTTSEGGQTASSGVSAGIYALKGDGSTTFWRHTIVSNKWATTSAVPAAVSDGGALIHAGNNVLYALRGGLQKKFYQFNGAWTAKADAPATVGKGGSLVPFTSNTTAYLYAFGGNDTTNFWRYNMAANTWDTMNGPPKKIKEGGALATDGAYIYALMGNTGKGAARKYFNRYNPAANTWSTLASIPAETGWGAALTRIGNVIYAVPGNNKTGFYGYNIASNVWSTLAVVPGAVGKGGSLTTDGTLVYALRGNNQNSFYQYDPALKKWTTKANAPATVGGTSGGGSIAWTPGSASGLRQVGLEVQQTLVSSGTVVAVVMTVQSSTNETLVRPVPASLTVTASNGATATLVTGPVPATTALSSNTPATFTWTYLVKSGTNVGSVSFSAGATNSAGTSFGTAKSGSIIVAPPLVFRAKVNNPITVGRVENTAMIRDLSGALPLTLSETVYTALAASIGDRVWADADGDGIQDTGEPGIAGVAMFLKDAGGTILNTAVTDSRGLYYFFGLATNVPYTVAYDLDTVGHGYLPSTPLNLVVTLTTLGQQYAAADFGLQPPGAASIGGRVWQDADEDGVQDASEGGLSNVTVQLFLDVNTNGAVDAADYTLKTELTDTNGTYVLSGLRTNAYLVQVDGASLVASPYGGASAISNAMNLVSGTSPHAVTLTVTNQAYATGDFGYNWCGQIGSQVWWDDDRDGMVDVGEPPIAGAYVMLFYDLDADGILNPLAGDTQIKGMPTSTNGTYLFTNLPPGTYLVDVYEDSIGLDGPVPTTPYVRTVNLGPCESHLDADFGYFIGARIEGNVYWDANRNLILDFEESGLTNAKVYLNGIDTNGYAVAMTNLTDALGQFVFVAPEGEYTLTYSLDSVQASYPLLRDPTTPTNYTFQAVAGDEWHPSFDFGVDNVGRIGDTVFGDINSNGTQDLGEPGLENVMVVLYDAATNVLELQITDATGRYQFIGLDDGTYLAQVMTNTLPAGYLTVPTADPTAPADSWGAATVADGGLVATMDFGYPPVPGIAYHTVSGTIYTDANLNGVFGAGEAGLSNVTVRVAVDTNRDGTVEFTFSSVTASNGVFAVAGIRSNSAVTITVDEATLPDTAHFLTGDPNGAPLTNVWTIAAISTNASSLDFGYAAMYGTVSGTSCIGDGDGFYDPAQHDIPLAFVEITLRYSGRDGILGTDDDWVRTADTDLNGSYAFDALPPGYYSITENKVASYAYLDLADADGGDPNMIYATFTLGEEKTHQDFENTHWLGTAGVVYNAAVMSSNEYIWTDKPSEQRIENVNAVNDDIREVRMFANDSNFYIRVTMDDIQDDDLPYVAIGLDTRQSTNSAALNWLGDDSGLGLGGDYFDGPAATHYPVRNIIVHKVAGTARAELFASDGYAWYPPPSGWSAAIISTVNDGLELRIPRADLMIDGTITGRFTVASFLNTGLWANEGDSTLEAYPGTANAADSMSIPPAHVNDGRLDVNAWREDISDFDVDFWVDVRFDETGIASNARPSSPQAIAPTNGAEVSARPTLSWSGSTDSDGEVTGYFLEASTNSSFNGETGTENGLIALRVNLPPSQTNYVLSTVATQYWWRVRARDTAGMLSGATVQEFRIGGKTDVEGPVPTLLYVGTNLTSFLGGDFDEFIERYGYIQSVTDAEMAQGQQMGFAIRWDDPSGVFATNWMSTNAATPGAFTWNIQPEDGRVSPNWDVVETNTQSGSSAARVTNQWFWGTNVSAVGNAAMVLTNWAHAAFAITNFLETLEYYLMLSAEDACDQNAYDWDEWNSQGAASLPDWGGFAADAPNTARNITANYPLRITMRDDDLLPPAAARGANWANDRSLLASNAAGPLAASGSGQAALYQEYDGMLVTNRLTLLFNAYDAYSGIQAHSNGPASTNTSLSIGFGPRLATNTANYSAAQGMVSNSTLDTTVLAWHWNGFTADDVTELWGGDGSGTAGATNPVWLTLWDNDSDRPDDQSVARNVIFGNLQVLDDDVAGPVVTLADIQGNGAQHYYTDSGEVLFYDFGTGDPASLQPARGFPSLVAADLTVTGEVPATATTGNPSGSAVHGSGWTDANQSYWEWVVTVDPGFKLNLLKMAFASRATSTGPTAWALKNSADGFSTPLASGTLNNNGVFETIAATNLAASDNSGTVIYRLYGTGASSAAGTWRLDNVSFTGKVSSISGTFLATDSDLNTNGLAISASVRDSGSGIFNINHATLKPTFDLESPSGVISPDQSFGAGPTTDGAAKTSAATLAATNGFAYADIVLGMYTVLVAATDYDVDRLNDSLFASGSGVVMVVDDDTAGPKFSSLRGTYLTFNGVSAGSEANAVTDGMLTNGLSISNRVYDEKSGVLQSSLQFWVQDPDGWDSGWQDFTVRPADGEARTNKYLGGNTVGVAGYSLDLNERYLGEWTAQFRAADFDADRADDSLWTTQSFAMFVVDDDTVGPRMTNFTSQGTTGALIATGFEAVDGWGLHDNGDWTEEANDGTWTATSVYIGTFYGRGEQGYYPGFNATNDALQLPAVDRPGWLILWARLSAAGESKMALEQWNGATWDSLGTNSVMTTNYAEHSWTIDSTDTNVVLRLRMIEKTDGERSIYFDDLVVARNRAWTNAGMSLAWEAADDLSTGDSGVDEYRVVPLGGPAPLQATNGTSVGLSQTVAVVPSAEAQGIVTGYVFAVDADQDRGTPDQAMGLAVPHVQRIDITPPTPVTYLASTTETVDDPTTQFDLSWVANNIGPDDPDDMNHPTHFSGDRNLLSPWRSYKIYYSPFDSQEVPGDDPGPGHGDAFIFTNFIATGAYSNWPTVTSASAIADPSAEGFQSNYSALTNAALSGIRLYDLDFDQDYAVVIVGLDQAGNEGSATAGSWATNNTIRFSLIRATTIPKSEANVAFPNCPSLDDSDCHTAAALYWTAAGPTNEVGVYSNVTRDYDLICYDAGRFQESGTENWHLVGTIRTNWFADDGGHHRPRGQIRFYRASYKDRWKTTNVLGRAQRPMASEEVYAQHNVVLSGGPNFVALHGEPTVNTFRSVFGGTEIFPGGASALPESGSTLVEFYSAGSNAPTSDQYWLSTNGHWYQVGGGDVSVVQQPAGFFSRGFSITLPDELPTNYVETTALDYRQLDANGNPIQVPAKFWEPILKVPTNDFSQTIYTGSRSSRVSTLIYNVAALRLPVSAHPSEMRLLESGFVKGPLGTSDEIYTMNTATKSVLNGSTIYCDANNAWRFATGNGLVPAGFFKPNDVIVIVSRNGGVGNSWEWTYSPTHFYALPDRWMGL
jgi:uncharacterized repeat protein (TIGR01451 family)